MTLTQEQVPWGAASMLIRAHGDQAKAYADMRISALTEIGDVDGATMWKKMANCIGQMSAVGLLN